MRQEGSGDGRAGDVPAAEAGPAVRSSNGSRHPWWMRAFWLLFALAGLGVGVWLFGRRRHDAGAGGA